MGKLNYNYKKSVFVLSVVSILIIFFSCVAFANAGTIMYALGQQHKVLENSSDNSSIATNTAITKNGFEIYKAALNLNKNDKDKLSDQQILDKITKRQSLYDEAIKNNITVSDAYVNQMIQSAKDNISNNSELKQQFQDYLAGAKLSEDEYWKNAKPTYKEALIIGKYLNSKSVGGNSNSNLPSSNNDALLKEQARQQALQQAKDKGPTASYTLP